MRKYLIGLMSCAVAAAAFPATAQTGSLQFQIVGDTLTQPYTITNNSTGGLRVVGFGVSLVSPYGFDTVPNPPGTFGVNDATPFTPNPAAAALTGYTGPATVAEGATSLAFTFSDFDVGELFSWLIDVDGAGDNFSVTGNELIGSTGYADFSNGLRGTGTFVALGSNGSEFVINAFAPTPSAPELGTWALMITGFGAVGAAMRRARATGMTLA